jgi:CAAX prenyl protease-like protein
VGLFSLWHFRSEYNSLKLEWSWPAVGAGLLVFVVWIALDTSELTPETQVALSIFASAETQSTFIVAAHMFSSVLIVPFSEEIAFRGYILRRLINSRVSQVRIGAFTLYSCSISSIIFGLTHDRWCVGTIAGFIYALVLYQKRNLGHAVLAHGVTNLLLVLWAFYQQPQLDTQPVFGPLQAECGTRQAPGELGSWPLPCE